MFVPNDSSGAVLYFNPTTVTANGTITNLQLMIEGGPGIEPPGYSLIIKKNSVDQVFVPFTVAGDSFTHHATISLPVAIGDALSARIVAVGGQDTHPLWSTVMLQLGASVVWSFDTPLAAGAYCIYKAL